MDNIRTHIARHLLSIGAVFLRPDEPFVWASGIKSPIYCDNRLILTAPEARNEVEQAIADTVRREYPEAQVLMGTATAGIAHAAIAAHLLGLPMGYVRSGSKDHGRRNQIEGKLTPGERVVLPLVPVTAMMVPGFPTYRRKSGHSFSASEPGKSVPLCRVIFSAGTDSFASHSASKNRSLPIILFPPPGAWPWPGSCCRRRAPISAAGSGR